MTVEQVAEVVTHLGDYPVALAVGAIAWLVLGDRGARVPVAVALAIAAASALKVAIGAPRPPGAGIGGYSMPSGHATVGMALYLSLALALDVGARRVRIGAGVAIGATIAASRVAIGVHYPADVVAGALLGLALVALVSWRAAHSPRRHASAQKTESRSSGVQ